MLKVFLVEDEFVIREGIKNNIDWKAHGYEFCGEAGDGELAYPMIQKLRPDIVITDIRMPFMDGLELSRLIRKELPDTEIIILSGYQEFEYAKEAIKLGVAQYLSKPINGEELLAELDELSAKIEEKRRAIQIRERYLQEMEENNLRERKKLFQELVTGESTVAELLESAEILGIDLSSPWYNIILFKTPARRPAPAPPPARPGPPAHSGGLPLPHQTSFPVRRIHFCLPQTPDSAPAALFWSAPSIPLHSASKVPSSLHSFFRYLSLLFHLPLA